MWTYTYDIYISKCLLLHVKTLSVMLTPFVKWMNKHRTGYNYVHTILFNKFIQTFQGFLQIDLLAKLRKHVLMQAMYYLVYDSCY